MIKHGSADDAASDYDHAVAVFHLDPFTALRLRRTSLNGPARIQMPRDKQPRVNPPSQFMTSRI